MTDLARLVGMDERTFVARGMVILWIEMWRRNGRRRQDLVLAHAWIEFLLGFAPEPA